MAIAGLRQAIKVIMVVLLLTLTIPSLQYVGIRAGLQTVDVILGSCKGEDIILSGAQDVYGFSHIDPY